MTNALYSYPEFRLWIDGQEDKCKTLGYISTDEMREHYRIDYFNKMINTACFQEATLGGPMAKIEKGEELEEVYMRTRWNTVVIAQLKVIDWDWKRKAHLMTLIKGQIEEIENQNAGTVTDLFNLAESMKEEVPKVNLVSRPYTPTTAKQVSRSQKERMESVKEKKGRNLKEEAAIQTGSLYVELAERKAASEKKGPRTVESRTTQPFASEHAEALRQQGARREFVPESSEFHLHSEGKEEEVSDRYQPRPWEDNLFQTGPLKILANALTDASQPIAREVLENIYKFAKEADHSRYEIGEKEMKIIRTAAGSRTDT